MLLGQSVNKMKVSEPASANAPWWVNPFFYCLYFLLPFFFITVHEAGPYMLDLKQEVNNLSFHNVMLGAMSIFMFMLGCLPFCRKREQKQPRELAIGSINRAMKFLATLSFLCNCIFFAPLVADPSLVFLFFLKGSDAVNLRQTFNDIPGVTSFMGACLPFFSLYSFAALNHKKEISRYNRTLFKILFFLVASRAILNSERIALVIAIVAYAIPRATFIWRPGSFRTFFPLVGLVGVFALFCVGEYFRSWQTYQFQYNSFYEFITVRFFGYFATSINNGAGVITYFPPIGMPGLTVSGFSALLRIFGIDYNPGADVLENYLARYSTPEFNNPGGLYVPFMDYGIVGGWMTFLVMGFITGLLFRKFIRQQPLGLLLYPAWFIGLLDIIRIWAWGTSGMVPIIITSLIAASIIRFKPKESKVSLVPVRSPS